MQLSLGFTPNIQSYVLASEGGYVNAPSSVIGSTVVRRSS